MSIKSNKVKMCLQEGPKTSPTKTFIGLIFNYRTGETILPISIAALVNMTYSTDDIRELSMGQGDLSKIVTLVKF